MRPQFSKQFDDIYAALPKPIQKKFDKQLKFLLVNLRHPSLRAKKYHETDDIWQARVDKQYRFYFRIERDIYILIAIKRHAD